MYFPGLNGLRFLAAFLVLLHHVEQVKMFNKLPNHWNDSIWENFFHGVGNFGVTFFFVLSGFLITYLLLVEIQKTGTVHVKSFYMRRILRIWPLYFFIVFLSFLVLPKIPFCVPDFSFINIQKPDETKKMFLYFIFSPHMVDYILNDSGFTFAAPMWSIGVEEQFYLMWPLILKKWRKQTIQAILLCLGLLLLFKHLGLFAALAGAAPLAQGVAKGVSSFFGVFRIDCMAVGGVGAWLYFKKQPVLQYVYLRRTQIFSMGALAACALFGLKFGPWTDFIYSALFLTVILNISTNHKKGFFKVEGRFFNYMGKISYGLYAFQWPVVVILQRNVKFLAPEHPVLFNIIAYAGSAVITTLLAGLSYRYLEAPFLRLKTRFSKIPDNQPTDLLPVASKA